MNLYKCKVVELLREGKRLIFFFSRILWNNWMMTKSRLKILIGLRGFSSSHGWMWELHYKERQEEKGTTEDEMVGWHHQLYGHGFGWTPGVGVGQGGLACCGSWGRKESDTTKRLNWTELNWRKDKRNFEKPESMHFWVRLLIPWTLWITSSGTIQYPTHVAMVHSPGCAYS